MSEVRCSEHPDQELERRYDRAAPVDRQELLRECPDPRHDHRTRHRCARCGGQVFTRRSYAAAYCTTRCRVAAHRARQRELAAARVALAAAPTPGTPAGPDQGPAVAAPGGQS